jgi:hypothetical protein
VWRRLAGVFEIKLVVSVGTDNFGVIVAAQDDVLRLDGYDESG